MINDRNDCFFNFERIAGISCFLKNRKSNGHVIKIPYHIFKQLITTQISLVHKIFILSIFISVYHVRWIIDLFTVMAAFSRVCS